MDYEKILEIIKKLKDSAKRKLIKDIFLLLVSKEKQNNCAELVCPHCNSKYIVKNGKNKDKQRYKCKSCRKSFIPETNTPIYYSKKDIAVWIQYLECLFAQNSLKDCAEKCKISVSTAFFWRHRILDAIREITNKQVLKDKIQCDETYFNESFKGNHKNSKFVMPRKPHKRGSSCHLRGISHQKVCVLTALDNSNILYAAPITMGRPASSDLIRVLQNRVKRKSILVTDSLYAYKNLASFLHLNHIKIPSTKHRLSNYNIQKINSLHSKIKRFFVAYKGVSTKYLSNYIALFHYIFDKIENSPLLIRGEQPFRNSNFKGRPPIFD